MIRLKSASVSEMVSTFFYNHGKFCATHPWEVIVGFLTVSLSMLSTGTIAFGNHKICGKNHDCLPIEENRSMDVIIMTFTRCVALLYVYHQFRKLYQLGSKYLVTIAGIFMIFSSFIFSSSVINFLEGDFSSLKDALPFFLLLIDLSKASFLTQFALSARSQEEVRENISRGLSILGPSMTLDTIVETLVIGIGTLSGVRRLESVCCFACMSAVINYAVFMTFFPACLSLILELSYDKAKNQPLWHLSSLAKVLKEEDHKLNPVLQRVKVIMSAGLVIVHAHSRWISDDPSLLKSEASSTATKLGLDFMHSKSEGAQFFRWLFDVSAEEGVLLVIVCALAVKYMFFENYEKLGEHMAVVMAKSKEEMKELDDNFQKSLSSKSLKRQFSSVSTLTDPVLSDPNLSFSKIPESPSVSFTIGEADLPEIKEWIDQAVQTALLEDDSDDEIDELSKTVIAPPRPLQECVEILNSELGPSLLTDDEVLLLVENKFIAPYKLESILGDPMRGVKIRRSIISEKEKRLDIFEKLPYKNYDYSLVMGACCENVVGYVPIPVGIAGPLLLDGKKYSVPMATTEGCLVASTNRGCHAIMLSGGAQSSIVADGMSRGPVIRLPTSTEAAELTLWLKNKENYQIIKEAFDSTSRFARLQNIHVRIAGRYVFIRLVALTGDAMGMNMVTKGTDHALQKLQSVFPNMEIISLSGNYCTDKKPSAVNWIEGRGKSVVCEATIPAHVIKTVLKTTASALVDVNISKNLVGSAVAGCLGGFNAHASNVVTAIYIATGQDPAQNVVSSNCLTLMEISGESNEDLYITCSMPSIEIGTIGGGTILPPQGSCLELLGVKGASQEQPGQNACTLARIICGSVLASELSLMSALAAGHLVRAHMRHNRSSICLGKSAAAPLKIESNSNSTTLSPGTWHHSQRN